MIKMEHTRTNESDYYRETNTLVEDDFMSGSKTNLELIDDGARFKYTTGHLQTICDKLGKKYNQIFHKDIAGFDYYCYANTNKYVCFLSRGLLMQVREANFRTYGNKYANHKVLQQKYITVKTSTIMIIYEQRVFKPQIGFSLFKDLYNQLTRPIELLSSAKKQIETLTSTASKLIIIDVIALIMQIRDSYFSATSLVACLMSLYTLHVRYMQVYLGADKHINIPPLFNAQSGPSLTELLIGFSALGLPGDILNAIKTFSTLTGKRIFESDFFLDTARQFFESLITIVEWIAEPFSGVVIIPNNYKESMIKLIKTIGSSVFLHADVKQVCEIYTKYVSNPQLLFDPAFRQNIMNTYDKCIKDPQFMSYLTNANNKYFITTWTLFENNVVKSCKAFDTSGREEPVCFIFEGGAGSGKSTLMNSFVNVLREARMTTICHAVPAAEDGKDFYDDYENQEVFVMDDVGQQGRSQWRYLINYVSPVKYPLPCATASKKNTKFFNSKVILITTNHFTDLQGFTSSDCISEPEALFRRAHVFKVDRGNSNHFSQRIQYMKYDHITSKKWEKNFLHHNAIGVPIELASQADLSFSSEEKPDIGSVDTLTWLYRVFTHVIKTNDMDRRQATTNPDDLRRIINTVNNADTDVYHDAEYREQTFNFYTYIKNQLAYSRTTVIDQAIILKEFSAHYLTIIAEEAKKYMTMVCESISLALPFLYSSAEVIWQGFKDNILFVGILGVLFTGVIAKCYSQSETVGEKIELGPLFVASNLHREKPREHVDVFGKQSATIKDTEDQWIQDIRRGCKTLRIRGENGEDDTLTQCVVSGKRLLLPAHTDIERRFVDLYDTWDHYLNNHVHVENVQLKMIKRYFTSDLAVYEIIGTIPLYKLNKQLFANGATTSKNWFLINSTGYERVTYDVDVKRNVEKVTYGTVREYSHNPGGGYITPFTTEGACGTVLAAPGVGILGFHVAGGDYVGFCCAPPESVREEIVNLMLAAPAANGFTLDDKIIPGISGARIRYERPIQQTHVGADTSYTRSILHRDVCKDLDDLIGQVERSPEEFTKVPMEDIDRKGPPNFKAEGTPAKTLKKLSQKTFMHQGRVTSNEIDFMKEYMRSIMVQYSDLTDYETAFGGPDIPPLNKDSSNGYGCIKGKEHYFDFENRTIKPEMIELAERLRDRAERQCYDYDDYMCREVFKDELRKTTKINTPRTFRVMPLGHIWWTKKIFGKLLIHFKKTRMDTGICVGYNPYLDGNILAKKLLQCEITGDADFGKWDGTILAAIIRLITDVFSEFYQGEHLYMIDWLTNTIANSFVLVNDEIWATTHGLPSGTWLTLLLNCLINKCLTALVVYRHKTDAIIDDVHDIVDFVTGDDKVFGVPKEMKNYFDLLKVKKVTEDLGMDCTNGDKSVITKPSQDFDKLTFVKRHFRMHPVLQRYIGCLSLDTIFNTLQWINNQAEDPHESMIGKMRAMQIESYIHSPVLFKALTRIFEDNFPFAAFFDDRRVIKILNSPDGYEETMCMSGKFFM